MFKWMVEGAAKTVSRSIYLVKLHVFLVKQNAILLEFNLPVKHVNQIESFFVCMCKQICVSFSLHSFFVMFMFTIKIIWLNTDDMILGRCGHYSSWSIYERKYEHMCFRFVLVFILHDVLCSPEISGPIHQRIRCNLLRFYRIMISDSFYSVYLL